jgi:8-oxo-dGTP pyrophosphatase MutT (NUDIX family)
MPDERPEPAHAAALLEALAVHRPEDEREARALETIRAFVRREPQCFSRELAAGHVTGSAWVLDKERARVLLTHHRKLDLWLQLGGHADGDSNVARVALREAREESGLSSVVRVGDTIFDVDVHVIPARGREPAHYHYDIRYLFEADRREPLRISSESKDLAWIELARVASVATDSSVLRMVAKSSSLSRGAHTE